MPSPVVVGDVLEFVIVSQLAVQTCENTMHALVVGPLVGVPTDKDMATALDVAINAQYKALMATTATYRGVSCRRKRITPPPSPQDSIANLGFGTGPNAVPMPTQTRGLLKFETDFAGRNFRGRQYIAFPCTAQQAAAGDPTGGYVTALGTYATALLGATTLTSGGRTATVQWVIYHQRPPKPPATTPVQFSTSPITSHQESLQWATQRKSGALGRANLPPF